VVSGVKHDGVLSCDHNPRTWERIKQYMITSTCRTVEERNGASSDLVVIKGYVLLKLQKKSLTGDTEYPREHRGA
jgi:hypothetical protein